MRTAVLFVGVILALLGAPAASQAVSPLAGEWHFDTVASDDGAGTDTTPDSSGNARDLVSCVTCVKLSDGGKFSKYLSETNVKPATFAGGIELQRVTLLAWM